MEFSKSTDIISLRDFWNGIFQIYRYYIPTGFLEWNFPNLPILYPFGILEWNFPNLPILYPYGIFGMEFSKSTYIISLRDFLNGIFLIHRYYIPVGFWIKLCLDFYAEDFCPDLNADRHIILVTHHSHI